MKRNPWRDIRLHGTVLVLVVIAELIGTIKIPITKDVAITIMPLIYTIILGLAFYLIKPIKWIHRKQARIAEGAMMLFIGVLIAKLAVSSGQSIGLIFENGSCFDIAGTWTLGNHFGSSNLFFPAPTERTQHAHHLLLHKVI